MSNVAKPRQYKAATLCGQICVRKILKGTTTMGEPIYPPNSTEEQRQRIDQMMLGMMKPRRQQPTSVIDQAASGGSETMKHTSKSRRTGSG
jgi:hypothetical protein